MACSYLPVRMIITAIAIVFDLYPSVCTAILSLFLCISLDKDVPPYAQYAVAKGWFMQQDSNVRCFQGVHLLPLILVRFGH